MRALRRLVACCGLLLAWAPTAAAHHTPVPGTVALVGSLQSELGCPGDWQPECAATRLAPVAGSPGVFRATFDVPAGAFEYKVALNGSWDENYGAGGAPGGANLALTAPGGAVTFTYDHATHIIADDTPRALQAERGAHWLRAGVIAWQPPAGAQSFRLHHAPEGGLRIEDGAVVGGSSAPLALDPAGLPADVRAAFPHLAAYGALARAGRGAPARPRAAHGRARRRRVRRRGRAARRHRRADPRRARRPLRRGAPRRARPRLAARPPGAGRVGADRQARRPAASTRRARVRERRVAMRRGGDGTWRATGDASWRDAAYRYAVSVYVPAADAVVENLVTDPYSVALTTNSARSVLADLDDPALTPRGWRHLRKPPLAQPADATIYELHVRDFSISDATVPAAHRGTYLAFTDERSDGMRHLRGLARAGLNTLHLLPSNDIATIEEDRAAQAQPACDLRALPPDSPLQQACVTAVAGRDGFNWGYDPLHYTTPEGSYATEPDGPARTLEFRRMVGAVNGAGLRVVMDVVYNHTPASGQDPKSILDRIVPGYYQRLNPVHRGGGDVDVLPEHGDRAPHDGEADGRLAS